MGWHWSQWLGHAAGIPLGLLYSNAGEWFLHKYVLHGLGKKKGSFWSFHWREHHRASRRHGFVDPDYTRSLWGWHAQSKEALALFALAVVHAPLVWVVPTFALTAMFSAYWYYRVHKRAHLDAAWAQKHLPWHIDHHLGPNQDCNWCVSWPWFDIIMGTRQRSTSAEWSRSMRQNDP
jgi:hypothetical protein